MIRPPRWPVLALAVLFIAGADSQAQDQRERWIQRWGLAEAADPIDFDPARNHLLTRCGRCAVLWDVERGLALRHYTLTGHLVALRFLGDAGVLLASEDRLVLVERESGHAIRTFDLHDVPIHRVAVAADGRWIAVAHASGHVSVWDARTGQPLHRLDAGRRVLALAFSPDGRLLLAGSSDGVGILWDAVQGRVRHRFLAPTQIRLAQFSADGQRIVTAGSGEYWHTPRVVVWDAATARPLQVIPRAVLDAYFVGDHIALILPDGRRELWPADRHEAPPAPEDWPRYPLTPKQQWLVAPNHWVLHINKEEPRAVLAAPAPHTQLMELPAAALTAPLDHHPIAFSRDGRWLLTGGGHYDSVIRPGALWDLASGRLKHLLPPGNLGAFHPDGQLLIWGGHRELSLVEISSGKVRRTLKLEHSNQGTGRAGILTDVAISRDGNSLLSATGNWYDGDGGSLLLWDLNTGEQVRSYFKTDKAVLRAAFTASGQHIIAALTPGDAGSAGIDQLTVLETKSGHPLHSRTFGYRELGTVKLASAGRFLAVNVVSPSTTGQSVPGTYRLDLRDFSGERLAAGQPAAFTPDGQVLALFEQDRLLTYWNVADGRLLHGQSTPLKSSRPVLFHPGQRLIAGVTRDASNSKVPAGGSAGLQLLATGELEAELFRWAPDDWLIATGDGHLSGSEGGLARVTWREPGSTRVYRESERTAARQNKAGVSTSLMASLPAERTLTEVLEELPEPAVEAPAVNCRGGRPWFQDTSPLRRRAIERLRQAGAGLRIDKFRGATFVHLENRAITAELLAQLRFAGAVDRLYLAATGITDEQLDTVGLQRAVKRLSLWHNPITDRGLLELTGLWNLEVLDVHGTHVTAAGVNALQVLPKLQALIIPGQIDLDDLAPLKERHPELEIIRRDD